MFLHEIGKKEEKKCFNGISTTRTPAKAGVRWSKYTTPIPNITNVYDIMAISAYPKTTDSALSIGCSDPAPRRAPWAPKFIQMNII